MADPAADTTLLAAFLVGFASFISPCVLPLVPGYLSSVSGVPYGDLRAGTNRRRVLLPALVFCASFTVIFVALGMTASSLGSTLSDHRELLDRVAGAVIIALGLLFVLTALVPRLAREWRPDALMARATAGPVLAGAAFAVAWTPCIGPTLGAILSAAATSTTMGRGGLLLAVYSAGLAVPFLLSAVAFNHATRAFRWLRDRYVAVTAVSGAVLVGMGVLMLTGELATLNAEAQRLLDALGLDFVYEI
jgi:cytochrome c-type biogenesis protein